MRTTKALKNIAVNVTTRLSVVLLTFFVVPYVFNGLGKELYGLNALLFQTIGYLGLADLGVGTAVSLAFYKSLSENNQDKTNSILSSSHRIFLGISFFIICVGVCASFFIDSFFKIEESAHLTAQIVLIIYTLKSAVTYCFAAANTLLMADQSNYKVGIVNIIGRPSFVLANAVVIYLGYSIIGIALGSLLITILIELSKFRIILREYPWLNFNYKERSYSDLFQTTSYVFVDRLLALGVKRTDFILIGIFLGSSFVGNYALYTTFIVILNRFTLTLLNPMASGLGEMFAKKELKKALELWKDFTSFMFFLSTIVCVGLVFYLQSFMAVWVGKDVLLPDTTAYFFIANFWILPSMYISELFLRAQNLFKEKMIGSIGELIINLGLSIILLPKLGVLGALIGTFTGYYLVRLWFVPWLLFKSLEISLTFYFKELFKYFGLASLLLAIGYFSKALLVTLREPDSWLGLMINGVPFAIVIFAMSVLLFHVLDKNFVSTRQRIIRAWNLAKTLIIQSLKLNKN